VELGSEVQDGPRTFSAVASTLSYIPESNPLTSTASGGTASIAVAAFNLQTSSKGTISYNSGSITGLAQGTAYWVVVQDYTLAGGTQTFLVYGSKAAALASSSFFL
jgi:hypothetical protein